MGHLPSKIEKRKEKPQIVKSSNSKSLYDRQEQMTTNSGSKITSTLPIRKITKTSQECFKRYSYFHLIVFKNIDFYFEFCLVAFVSSH